MQNIPNPNAKGWPERVGKITRFLLTHPIKALGLLAIVFVLAAGFFLKNFQNVDNALSIWFDHSSPAYNNYEKFVGNFGQDRMLLIAFEMPDAFDPKALTFIKTLSESLKKHKYVVDVLSLTEQEQILTVDDNIEVKKLFATIPTNKEELTQKRAWALQQNDVVGVLTNPEANISVVMAYTNNPDNHISNKQTFADLRAIVEANNTQHYPLHYSGVLANEVTFNELTQKNQQQFLYIMLIVMFVVIYAFFRNIYITLLPIVMMVVCIAITQALFFIFNPQLNAVTSMMGPILMAACIADSVHAILGYNEYREQGLSLDAALIANSKEISIPCFFTALTTFAGFMAFNVSPLVPNQQLGYFSAFGVMLAYILTLFLIPLLIKLFAKQSFKISQNVMQDDFTQKLLGWSFRTVQKYRKRILFGFVIITAMSFWGITRINIETNTLKYYPPNNPQRIAGEFLEKELAGIGSLELIFSSHNPDQPVATDPQALQAIEMYSHDILKNPLATKILGYTNWLKQLNQAWHNNDPAFAVIPSTRAEITQLLLIAESSDSTRLAKYKTFDNEHIRLTVKCHWLGSEELNRFARQLLSDAQTAMLNQNIEVQTTGQGYLWIQLDNKLLETEFLSFSTASISVAIMMMLILKNVRAGLISIIPNILPIFMALGAMGFFKIHLNLATVMTAGVAIGITVDDSIHYLVKFKKVLAVVKDYSIAIAETNKSIGTAVIFNSVVLMAGFGVLGFSDFLPSRYFGLVTALTLFLSIFTEILLMPILLLIFKPFKIVK